MFRRFEALFALFTSPAATVFDDFFVAILSRAGGVRDIICFDVHDGRSCGEILWLVGQSKAGLFDVIQAPNFSTIEAHRRSTPSSI